MTCTVRMTTFARAGALALVALCACAFASSGCGKKKKSAATVQAERAEAAAQVEGLGALPADVRVVVGANVPMLAASKVVRRAFTSMVERDGSLAGRIAELQERCKIDPAKDLSSVVVGLLGSTSQRDVVLVAKGHFDEAAIAKCVEGALSERGGSLEKKPQAGVTIYLVHNPEGGGDVVFTFGAPDVLVVADSEALLLRARDPAAPKLTSNAAMMKLVKATDSRAALWGAGVVAPEVGAGLVKASGNRIKEPASAMYGFVNLDTGLALELALQMASPDDAKAIDEVVQKQLSQFSIMAQAYSLGSIVNKIRPAAQGSLFVVTLSLDAEELARLESLLDKSPDRKAPHGDQAPHGDKEQGKEGTP
jgi:hypothetical protein